MYLFLKFSLTLKRVGTYIFFNVQSEPYFREL